MSVPVIDAPAAGAPADVLVRREDLSLAARMRGSARCAVSPLASSGSFDEWFDGRRRAHAFRVDRIPFAELDGWSFDGATGDLGHRSGRFFSVHGLDVSTADAGNGTEADFRWHQPVISQPEIGILGLLVKEFDGVPHFLMQAKMEPGNPNLLQLSPTVQATRSNYTGVHRGAPVRYLEHFVGPDRSRTIADVLQSEHGAWFYRKSNRNMIVEAVGDVPLHDDFRWLTLGEIGALLHRDNVINMDSRTVLACAPLDDPYDAAPALHSDTELLSWFTGERARHDVSARRTPLGEVPGWVRHEDRIERADGRYFRVVAVSVEAGSREVARWSQPLIEPCGTGVTAFLSRRVGGRLHVLARAMVEGGFLDTVELAPTVQCTPSNYPDGSLPGRPRFLDQVLSASPGQIVYEAVHSEEGGRFLNAESRYLVVDAGDSVPLDPPPGFRWVTPAQLRSLARHGHYVNVQARTLLACLAATGDAGR